MPIWKFKCKCGKEKEELVLYSEEEVICECGNKMERIFTPSHARINSDTRGMFGRRKKKLNLNLKGAKKLPLKHGQRGGMWQDKRSIN